MKSVIEEAVVVVCQGSSPAAASASSSPTLVRMGGRKVAEPCTGVPALVDQTCPVGVDAVHLCLSSVFCKGGSGLTLVLPPAR